VEDKNKAGIRRLGVLVAVLALAGSAAWLGGTYFASVAESVVPTVGDVATFNADGAAAPGLADLPDDNTAASKRGKPIRMVAIAWNALGGTIAANGGTETAPGSLMERAGVRLKITRNDMYDEQEAELVKCAKEMNDNDANECSGGVNLMAIMGDAGASVIAALNNGPLAKLLEDLRAEIMPGTGISAGEDGCYGPVAWRDDPESMRGALMSGVVKDGDWNICQSFLEKNNICNNPDWTTWDPNCMNWLATPGFVQADEAFISATCEDRPIVKNGKRTGGTKHVCVEGGATWFPGDDAIVTGRGGIVPLLTTRENSGQMPLVFIGIRRWDKANESKIAAMLKASYVAAAQMADKSPAGQKVMQDFGRASAEVWGEENAAFWIRGYRSYKATDPNGVEVQVGGSHAFTLGDALRYYGLDADGANTYAETYTTFGKVVSQQYPHDLPTFPAVTDVFNLAPLRLLANDPAVTRGVVSKPDFSEASETAPKIGDRDWTITFDSGSNNFTLPTLGVLDELRGELLLTENSVIEVHGYTDSQGAAEGNQLLSESRATAVRDWLIAHGNDKVPAARFLKVLGHGESEADATRVRAQDRRVRIVLRANAAAK
jgi:outer membrane protein OmpA-like peptidoglycan-associated protein